MAARDSKVAVMKERTPQPSRSCGCHNLNDNEVSKRRVLGYASLVAAFVLVALNKMSPQPDWMHAMPAIPFFFAYLNALQAKTRTCVALALMERDMSGDTIEPVSDRATARALKTRSAQMILVAATLAVLSAALCWKI